MNAMKPALVCLRVKRLGIVIGFSLVAAMSVHADLEGSNELSTTRAEAGVSTESANGTGTPDSRQAPSDLSSANGTGLDSANGTGLDSANGTGLDGTSADTFADFSAVGDAQSIACESAEGDASDICGSAEPEAAELGN